MSDAKQATPAAELERQICSATEPKNEREWWSHYEIARLRAELTAERERADRAGRDCNGLSLDVQTLTAERDALRERVARLVGAMEPVAKVHINRAGGNVGIAWHAIGIDGSLPALADGEVLYVLRTALGDK